MKSDLANKVLEMAKVKGVLRSNDLKEKGIPRTYLSRLQQKGLLKRVSRGLYVATDIEPTSHHTLAQVAKRIPDSVVCLLSALQFHEITTQQPYQVWIAIDRTARRPKVPDLPIHIVRFSGKALKEGIETHYIEGVQVKVYNVAKTVADCFKYRNKIGLDVALEALRECRRQKRCSYDDLWHYAKICRVTNIMRPYMETIL